MKKYYLVATTRGEWNNKYGFKTMKTSLYEVTVGALDLTKSSRTVRKHLADIVTVFDCERKGHKHLETNIIDISKMNVCKIPDEVAVGYKIIAKDVSEAIEKFLNEKWVKINHVKEALISDEPKTNSVGKKKNTVNFKYIDDAAPALSKNQVKKKYRNKYSGLSGEKQEIMKHYRVANISYWRGVIIPDSMHGLFSEVHDEMGGNFCGFYSYRYFRNSTMIAYSHLEDDKEIMYKVLKAPVRSTFDVNFYSEGEIYAPDDDTAIALFINGNYKLN